VLKDYGYKASFVNPGSTAEDFSKPFLRHIKTESTKLKILLPLGNLARTVIQDQLKDAADCIRINVYKTDALSSWRRTWFGKLRRTRYDMLIFTSPSGIKNFLKAVSRLPKAKTYVWPALVRLPAMKPSKMVFIPW
jgi:uroporphyrinogen-III synthase